MWRHNDVDGELPLRARTGREKICTPPSLFWALFACWKKTNSYIHFFLSLSHTHPHSRVNWYLTVHDPRWCETVECRWWVHSPQRQRCFADALGSHQCSQSLNHHSYCLRAGHRQTSWKRHHRELQDRTLCAGYLSVKPSFSAFNTVCVNEPLFGNKVMVMSIVSTA